MRTARRVRTLVAAGLFLGLVGATRAGLAQDGAGPPASPAPQPAPVSRAQAWQRDRESLQDPATLQRRLAEQWRIVPLRDGILLVPRRHGRSLKGIEVREGSIAIDGQVVTGEEVRARLGADADAVLAASYLDPATLLEPPTRATPGATVTTIETARPTIPTETPAPAHHRSARVSFGRDLVVAEGERVDEAAVAILGSVTVDGEVNGDVVAVLGDVRVGPRASVRGNLTAVGGTITTDPAARLYGGSNEVAIKVPNVSVHVPDFAAAATGWHPPQRWFTGLSLAWTVFRLAFVALFALALGVLARGPIGRMRLQLRDAPVATTLVGVAAHILLVPAVVALALFLLVSVVGIPLLALLPFALLALGVAWVAGFAAVAESVGERLGGRGHPLASLGLGLLAIWVTTLLARGASLGVGGWLAAMLVGFGLAIEFVAWSAALGALLLGWRRAARSTQEYSAVPPVPTAPAEW